MCKLFVSLFPINKSNMAFGVETVMITNHYNIIVPKHFPHIINGCSCCMSSRRLLLRMYIGILNLLATRKTSGVSWPCTIQN